MADYSGFESHDSNVQVELEFGGANGANLEDITPREIILGESLLTPGLQTSVILDSHLHTRIRKNLDVFKGSGIGINLFKPRFAELNLPASMRVVQTLYRLENRHPLDDNNEQLTLRACDQSLLYDAKNLVSKSWKCAMPSSIASEVLKKCAGAVELDIQSASPGRDYIAENIHPFQVVKQQTNAALDGDDPSFLHYMTYNVDTGYGIHHFRSLKNLCAQAPVASYHTSNYNTYSDPAGVMEYSFPCDFDLLSDLLNGIDENGKDISTLIVFNPLKKMFSLVGSQTIGCGIGTTVIKYAQTNKNSSAQQNMCDSNIEKYRLKRQARMGLLEKDKIALRMTVPWNPSLHAGKTIDFTVINKENPTVPNYGSGRYLILHMMHIIKRGGYAVTKLDCVSQTAGRGEV